MHFRVEGLPADQFVPLFGLDDEALSRAGAKRYRVERAHAAPCRISLTDAEPGESVLLVNYFHQESGTPYRQQGPIFVREAGAERCLAVDVIPPALARRKLSLRAFDAAGMMIDADLIDGREADVAILRLFATPETAYIDAHYATRGCFAARIQRA